MSSSQGPNNIYTGPPYPVGIKEGYEFNKLMLRDGSDWTRTIRERRMYSNYNASSTDNKNTLAWWEKFGNNFRLDYLTGRWKCTNCPGAAYIGDGVGQGDGAGSGVLLQLNWALNNISGVTLCYTAVTPTPDPLVFPYAFPSPGVTSFSFSLENIDFKTIDTVSITGKDCTDAPFDFAAATVFVSSGSGAVDTGTIVTTPLGTLSFGFVDASLIGPTTVITVAVKSPICYVLNICLTGTAPP